MLQILIWFSAYVTLTVFIPSHNAQYLVNRRRSMSVLQTDPIYSSGYALDTSPFASSYMPRVAKAVTSVSYPKSGVNTVFPRGYKDSQDFNVGYSLSLESGKSFGSQPTAPLVNLGSSEIITGSPKRTIKKYTNIGSTKTVVNFPQRQAQYAALETKNKESWKTVSPNIEIFQSKEIPFNHNDLITKSTNFDHQKALTASQGFDYSNVIDNINNHADNFKQSTILGGNKLVGTTVSLSGKQQEANIDLTKLQTTATELNEQSQQFGSNTFTETKFPQIDVAFQNTPKFPLDTHLLKEAGLQQHGKENVDSLPVQIDMTSIEKFKTDTEDFIKAAMHQNTAIKSQFTPESQFTHEPQFTQSQLTIKPQIPVQQFTKQFQFSKPQQQQQQHEQFFAPRPLQFNKGSNALVNFKDQKALHFDNADTNNFNNGNVFTNIQKQHGFRKGRYNLDNALSQSVGGIKTKTNYPVTNFRNYPEPSFTNSFDLKPPPMVLPRYRNKSKRFF